MFMFYNFNSYRYPLAFEIRARGAHLRTTRCLVTSANSLTAWGRSRRTWMHESFGRLAGGWHCRGPKKSGLSISPAMVAELFSTCSPFSSFFRRALPVPLHTPLFARHRYRDQEPTLPALRAKRPTARARIQQTTWTALRGPRGSTLTGNRRQPGLLRR